MGQAIGAVVFSNLSDRFGRRLFLILADVLTAFAGLALAFSPNIAAFSALRLINGICQQVNIYWNSENSIKVAFFVI